MPNPSVTYTFANSTTADATQVNQNFTDIINGLTDGTKDLTISALTVAGAASFHGAVTLGDGTPDDLTFNGSLASSIPIKTNASYDIGSSTLGLAGVYLGSSGGHSTRLVGSATTSYTLTFPAAAGSAGQTVKTSGSGALTFSNGAGDEISNIGLSASVASNLLTVALKDASGSDPSATSPVYITFRSSTATTGTPVTRTVSSALSINTIATGATFGTTSGIDQYIYIYAIDNAGTVELALAGSTDFDEGSLNSTTGVGGSSTSATTLYSNTSRSNVGIRLIGRITVNEVTAGTYASAPSVVSLFPFKDAPYVAASYYVSANVTPGANAQINFDTKIFDTHNAVTTGASWKFTAPFTGKYWLSVVTICSISAGGANYLLYKNGSSLAYLITMNTTISAGTGAMLVQLSAGDYIDVRVNVATVTVTGSGAPYNTHISISSENL